KGAEDVLLRPAVGRVPAGLVLRVPHVEVVVMTTHGDVILRASLLVETHQVVRLELVRLPGLDDVDKPRLRRMTIVFEVVLILRLALNVHTPGVPIAVLGRG